MSDRPDFMLHGKELSREELTEYLDSLKVGEWVIEVGLNAMKGQIGIVTLEPQPMPKLLPDQEHQLIKHVKCVQWHMDEGKMTTSVTAGTRRVDDVPEADRPKKLGQDISGALGDVLRLRKQENDGEPDSYHVHVLDNDKKIGHMYMEVDGYYVFAPRSDGLWEAPYLREIAAKLDILNEDWHRQVQYVRDHKD